VVIIEDQPIVRIGLVTTLHRIEGLKVIGEAADGAAGVEEVLRLRPDVTIMDIGLPILDGVEATRRIKESWPEALVLMLTSRESEEHISASLAAGADGYCLKSVSAEQLALALTIIMGGTIWLDPAIAKQVLKQQFATTSESKDRPAAKKERGKFDLSEREVEVLTLLVEGLNNQQMAERLCLSLETIKTHMRHIMEKLAVADRTQAAVKAMRQGLVE
jgi:two-component system, NarL family, response regulator LiaR